MAEATKEYPDTDQDSAGETSGGPPPVCAQPPTEQVDLSSVSDPDRADAIVSHRSKWVSGTTLRYFFFDAIQPSWDLPQGAAWIGDADQEQVVREAFREWEELGIGIDFIEVDEPSEAEVRIGFVSRDGSWSYLGRQILDHRSPSSHTMSFGWDLTDGHGRDTARHEIGHTLGMPHEHQNPNAGIVWDEQRTLEYFAGYPNFWHPSQTRHNVLRKLSERDVFGSTWDRDSIMHYGFPEGVIATPADLSNGHTPSPGFSDRDKAWARAWYPPVTEADLVDLQVNRSEPVQVLPGQQAHFSVNPGATRQYVFTTLGRSDTVLVLFEKVDGVWRQHSGDDDSGEDRNARIEAKLFAGREYILRARLYHSDASEEIAVVMF